MGVLYHKNIPYGGGGGAEIDDTTTALDKVWSSSKVSTELGAKANTSSLATVATSGSYNDLGNKPNLPVWTNGTSALVGATSCTITDASINSSSVIEIFTENSSNTPIPDPDKSISGHTLTLTFKSALTVDTTFYARVTNL